MNNLLFGPLGPEVIDGPFAEWLGAELFGQDSGILEGRLGEHQFPGVDHCVCQFLRFRLALVTSKSVHGRNTIRAARPTVLRAVVVRIVSFRAKCINFKMNVLILYDPGNARAVRGCLRGTSSRQE